jgi:hypothetical protein
MSMDRVPDRNALISPSQPGENQADYRERLKLLEAESLERRQQELDEQCSPFKTPADRIRIWERLHQLSLPRISDHRLVTVIAANTGLSVEEVQAEQRARAAAKHLAPAV